MSWITGVLCRFEFWLCTWPTRVGIGGEQKWIKTSMSVKFHGSLSNMVTIELCVQESKAVKRYHKESQLFEAFIFFSALVVWILGNWPKRNQLEYMAPDWDSRLCGSVRFSFFCFLHKTNQLYKSTCGIFSHNKSGVQISRYLPNRL